MAIYIVRVGSSGPVKLGYAANPKQRIEILQVGQPAHLNVLRVMEGCRQFEVALHRHFAPLRIRGEWFAYSEEMLDDLDFLRPTSADPVTPHGSLTSYMQAAGLTDAELAAKLEITQENIRLWRSGRRRIPAERAVELSAITGIPRHSLRPDLWDIDFAVAQ